jgi:oligopeptide transport system substrate-binding protein
MDAQDDRRRSWLAVLRSRKGVLPLWAWATIAVGGLVLVVSIALLVGLGGVLSRAAQPQAKAPPTAPLVTSTPALSASHLRLVTLNWNMGSEPQHIDPALAIDTTSINAIELLFLGLTGFDEETNAVVPELATEWDASQDGLVWTFRMRDDVPWVQYNPVTQEARIVTDGTGAPRMVNAHDVEYAVKRTLDPQTASDYAHVLYIVAGAMAVHTGKETNLDTVGVHAVDDYTVQFTLRQPAGYFPAIAGMWVARPVYKPAIDEYGAGWVEPGLIVTNGPYYLEGWVHDEGMAFAKNPYYYGADEVQIERVEAAMVMEASTALAMYEDNQLDLARPPLTAMDRVRADPMLSQELQTAPALCASYYGFTNNKPPFDDPLVRRAFSAAIDRYALVEEVGQGDLIPANTFAPQGIFGAVPQDPDIAPWILDPELGKRKAKEWLAEAGYPGGEGFPTVTLMHNTSEGNRVIAEAVQAMWRETLGVQVEVVYEDWEDYLRILDRKTPLSEMPHIWRLGWCADYADQNNWLHEVFNSAEGANYVRRGCLDDTCTEVEEHAFDRLTQEAGAEGDPERRKELYKRAEKLLTEEEAAYAPLYYSSKLLLVKPWLKLRFRQLGGLGIDKWTIDWEAKKAAIGVP